MTSWSDPAFAELAALATLRAGLAFPPGREETAEAAIRHAMQRADVSDARRYLDLLTTGLLSSDGLLFELTVGAHAGSSDPSALLSLTLHPEAAAWLSARVIESRVGTQGLAAQALGGLGPVAIGVAVYFSASFLLRLREAEALTVGLLRWGTGNGAR